MDELILKNFETLKDIKNKFNKLIEENNLLKQELEKKEKKPLIENNTRKEEKEIIDKLIKKYPPLFEYQNSHKSRLYIHKCHQDTIFNIITDKDDKKLYEYYYSLVRERKNKEKCFARVIIKGNDGWFNFKRCSCQKINENYCSKHLINLKDGDVRFIGSKHLPFHYGSYNHSPSKEDILWLKKMELLFPQIYFKGEGKLDLLKYDIKGQLL